jgi:hypothetical protein
MAIGRVVTISGREPDWDAIIAECRAEMLAELESQSCECCICGCDQGTLEVGEYGSGVWLCRGCFEEE